MLLTLVVLVVESASIAFLVLDLRDERQDAARDQSVMSLFWTAKAIEASPPEFHELIPAGVAQPGRVLFLEDKPAVADTDTAIEHWVPVVGDWLRNLGLSFRTLRLDTRKIYLPTELPPRSVGGESTVVERSVYPGHFIALPGFPDGRTPRWLMNGPDFVPEPAEKFTEVSAFVYALQLDDGRWLSMYARPLLLPPDSIAFEVFGAIGAASHGATVASVERR